MESKCQSVYHRSEMKTAPFRYCPDCGAVINDKLRPDLECAKFHTLRKTKGYKYCTDCGTKIRK